MRHIRLIAKNAMAHSLLIGIGLFFTIASARLLPPADYGEMRYILTLLPLFMLFSLPGYDSVILRNAHLRKRIPLLEIFLVKAGGGLIGGIVILAVAFLLRGRINPVQMFFLVWAAALLPLFDTGTSYRNYLIGIRLRHAAVRRVLRVRAASLTMMAAAFGLIMLLGLNRLYFFPAYLIAMIIPVLAAFFAIARKVRHGKLQPLSALDIPAAIATTMAGVVYTLSASLDKLLVRNELSAAELAAYSILVMAPQELSKLFDAMLPLFYRHLFFDAQRFNWRKLRMVVPLLPLVIVGYIIGFYYLSAPVFGPAYRYSLLSVMMSGLMIGSLSFEYLNNNRIFATLGSRVFFSYAMTNLLAGALILPAALYLGGIHGLIGGLIVKQLLTPMLFLRFHKPA